MWHFLLFDALYACIFTSSPFVTHCSTGSISAATPPADTSPSNPAAGSGGGKSVRFRNKEDLLRDLTSAPATSAGSTSASGVKSSGGGASTVGGLGGRPPMGGARSGGTSGIGARGSGSGGGVSKGARSSRPLFEVSVFLGGGIVSLAICFRNVSFCSF